MIVPGSNDGAYEPSRSFLSSDTSPLERADFATEFRDARSSEAPDPQKAIAAYRRLIASHPEFAESHYRLGKVLVETGQMAGGRSRIHRGKGPGWLPVRCQSDFRAILRSVVAGTDRCWSTLRRFWRR